ncbi:MAG: flagellar protein FlgN, partial [Syntrophomonas sp.]|nr:flagellar protein FlgN [Syntrophomonas sp.]
MSIGLDKDIKEFIDILGKQNRVLDSLVQLEETKRQVIILGQVEELNKLMQKEGILVSNIQKLEDARFKSHGKLARIWGTSVGELPASQILENLKQSWPESAGEMQEAVEQMGESIARLKASNSENNDLINQSLEYIHTLQSLLTGDVAGTYSDMGMQVDEST